MICGYVSFVLNGLYAETKKQASCIDVLSSDTAACFIISRRYLQLKHDQDFPALVKSL